MTFNRKCEMKDPEGCIVGSPGGAHAFGSNFQGRTERGIEEVEVLLEESGLFQVQTLNLRA